MIRIYSMERKENMLGSPRVVDFQKAAQYNEEIEKGKLIFFLEETDDISCYCLCGLCFRI